MSSLKTHLADDFTELVDEVGIRKFYESVQGRQDIVRHFDSLALMNSLKLEKSASQLTK